MGDDTVCDVVSPPERHIAVPAHEIVEVFRGRLGMNDRLKFQEMCKLVEATSQFEFLEIRRRIKRNFRLFSLGARGDEFTSRIGRALPRKVELQDREAMFITDFRDLMKAAHYQNLTQMEWDTVTEEDFQLTMPVDVNWDYMDKKILTRYWNEKQDEREGLAEMSNRILVFHRGVGMAKLSGLFLNEKVDLLVKYLVVDPLSRLWHRWTGKVEETGERPKLDEGVDDALLAHRNRRVVQRRTLRRALPTLKHVMSNMHRNVEIQEPTFKDTVVLYRKAGHLPRDMTNPSKQTLALAKRNIFIRLFDEIPMADLELIFPKKKVFIKPVMRIQLTAMVVIALVTAFTTVVGTDLSWAVVLPALGVVLARVGQVYTRLQEEKAQMMTKMATMLYDITRDSQEGAVYTLLDEMAEQYFKEVVMAYTLLLLSKEKLNQQGLDHVCENFLDEYFDLKIDFAIEDSLPRLERDGLVVRDKDGMFQSVDLDTAVDRLTKKWHSSFKEFDDIDENSSFLSGGNLEFGLVGGAAKLGKNAVDTITSGFAMGLNVFRGKSKRDMVGKKTS